MSNLRLTKNIKHDYFSEENIRKFPERLVIAGFIAADGCLSFKKGKTMPYLLFNICQKDIESLYMINSELCDSTRNISHLNNTNSNMLSFPSLQIYNDLTRFNITERKTKTFTLPKLKYEHMRYFLRGFYYGDGCVQYKKIYYLHIAGNELIMSDLRNYLMTNNIIEHCVYSRLKNSPSNVQLVIQNKHAIKFSDYLFNDDKMVLIKRKHVRYSDFLKYQQELLV